MRIPAVKRLTVNFSLAVLIALWWIGPTRAEDHLFELQTRAIQAGKATFGHWGVKADNYMQWGSHSNRLIPVYTFGTKGAGEGIDLAGYTGSQSPYRSEEAIRKLYGRLPTGTFNDEAVALDQTNIADIQNYAIVAGKKHVILVVFDGMDWQTTWAASIYKNKSIPYTDGRGTGLHYQDYQARDTSQFGYMVTSPYADEVEVDVNQQTVKHVDDVVFGGYAMSQAGAFPWSVAPDPGYIISDPADPRYDQAYTDSASSATSMTAGIKTYNAAINVDYFGKQAETMAHRAQKRGYRVGVVTSVPISHATPAAAYAQNVHRDDYQDLTRDLLGLKSCSHPEHALPGVDLLLGCGAGESRPKDAKQGQNFIPGNPYLTEQDLQFIDIRNGGQYAVAQRSAGVSGVENLKQQVTAAIAGGHRMFGFFGVKGGHLPFRTADGDYHPPLGRKKEAESYTKEDVLENPTLAEFTSEALRYLGQDDKPFWLMVEAGDVDWANHDNNIDNSIGAVHSGDAAVKVITDWVEEHSNWRETVLIVTADHGHYLVLEKPELLIPPVTR